MCAQSASKMPCFYFSNSINICPFFLLILPIFLVLYWSTMCPQLNSFGCERLGHFSWSRIEVAHVIKLLLAVCHCHCDQLYSNWWRCRWKSPEYESRNSNYVQLIHRHQFEYSWSQWQWHTTISSFTTCATSILDQLIFPRRPQLAADTWWISIKRCCMLQYWLPG